MYVWEDKGLNEFIWKQGAFPGFMSLNEKAVSQNPCSVFWKCKFLNPWGLPPCRRRWGVGYTTEPLLRRIHSIIRSLSAMFFLLKAAKLWAWWILNGGKKRERKRKTNDLLTLWLCGKISLLLNPFSMLPPVLFFESAPCTGLYWKRKVILLNRPIVKISVYLIFMGGVYSVSTL